MPEHSEPLSDPRVFAALGLDRLGMTPLRGVDPGRVGPFHLVALLGSGGMGRIYLGRDATDGYHGLAAVKVIRPEYAEDTQFRQRFAREAESLARVQGGQTAVLLGSGFDDDLLWMATEYIPGLSLSATIADHGVLDPAAAWRLAADLGRAVEAMAEAGVVHRDIKPSNVILGPDGCRVIDFGISQAGDTSSITMTGQQVGTPAYMSPEQVRGLPVGPASDVFAIGSVLAYAVAGNAPFGDGTSVDVLHRVAFDPPKDDVLERVAALDPDLAALVASCLVKDQGRRPAPGTVVGTALTRQVPAPWPQALNAAVALRLQVAETVRQLPLPPPSSTPASAPAVGTVREPVRETVVLSHPIPPAFAGPPTPVPAPVPPASAPTARTSVPPTPVLPAPMPMSTPAPTAVAPLVGPPYQQPTPPTVAALPVTSLSAPYVLQAAGPLPPMPPAVRAIPLREDRPRRRTVLLVCGAVLAVAAIATTAVLLTGPSDSHAAVATGTGGTVGTTGSLGLPGPGGSSPAPGTGPTGGASASQSAAAAASRGASAHGGTTTGAAPPVTSGAAGKQPAPGGSTQPVARPTTGKAAPPPPHTTAPAPPPVPPWIKNCTYYSGSQETDPGATGARVKEVQCILINRGYTVGSSGADGEFGPDTKAAVIKFQRAKGLEVDGEVGPETWPALRSTKK